MSEQTGDTEDSAPPQPTYTELRIREPDDNVDAPARRFWACSICQGVVVTDASGNKHRHDSFHGRP